jgi:hypothetical protein
VCRIPRPTDGNSDRWHDVYPLKCKTALWDDNAFWNHARTIWLKMFMSYRVDAKPFDAPPSVSAAEFYRTESNGLAEGCLLVAGN